MLNLDSAMKKSIFYVSFVMIVMSFLGRFSNPQLYPLPILTFAIVAEFILSIALIFSIKIVREDSSSLGVWSYLWRALLLRQLTVFFSVVAAMLFSYKPPLPSLSFTVFLDFVSLLFAPGSAWLCFSKNRRGQFAWLVNSLAGREVLLRK